MDSDKDLSSPFGNIQGLIDRIAEQADIGTVVLVLVLFLVIGLLLSERARNNSLVKMYLSQNTETVKVLTSVKNLMDASTQLLDANEVAVKTISERLLEIRTVLDIFTRPGNASNRKTPARKTTNKKG